MIFHRFVFVTLLAAGCGGSSVNSPEDAKKSYLGLDASIDKALTLGFNGFNSANSANISPQMTTGTKTGTMTITGQVDQGASKNKGMRLLEALAMYSDDGLITYNTSTTAPPMLTLSLRNIPTGTLDGTLTGDVQMSGDEKGALTLALAFSGMIQPMANDMTKVQRVPGSTHITGTATSPSGTYTVDLTR